MQIVQKIAATACLALATTAQADVLADFDLSEFDAGSEWTVFTPPVTVEGVVVRPLLYEYYTEDFITDHDITGTAEVQVAPEDFAAASGNALHTQRINMLFDYEGIGGTLEFDYLDREPRPWGTPHAETYNINFSPWSNALVNYIPTFKLFADFDGGITFSGSTMTVTETLLDNGDVTGHVSLTFGDHFTGLIVGGRDLWIDNISVQAVPEPGGLLLASFAGLLMLRRRR
jgi:MYXO-CTERM domain-containing protein